MLTEYSSTINNIIKNNCFYFDIDKMDELNNSSNYLFDLKNNKILEKMTLNSYKNIKSNSHSINDRVDEILKILN